MELIKLSCLLSTLTYDFYSELLLQTGPVTHDTVDDIRIYDIYRYSIINFKVKNNFATFNYRHKAQ